MGTGVWGQNFGTELWGQDFKDRIGRQHFAHVFENGAKFAIRDRIERQHFAQEGYIGTFKVLGNIRSSKTSFCLCKVIFKLEVPWPNRTKGILAPWTGTGVWGQEFGDRSLRTGVWGQEFGDRSLGTIVWGHKFWDRSLGTRQVEISWKYSLFKDIILLMQSHIQT